MLLLLLLLLLLRRLLLRPRLRQRRRWPRRRRLRRRQRNEHRPRRRRRRSPRRDIHRRPKLSRVGRRPKFWGGRHKPVHLRLPREVVRLRLRRRISRCGSPPPYPWLRGRHGRTRRGRVRRAGATRRGRWRAIVAPAVRPHGGCSDTRTARRAALFRPRASKGQYVAWSPSTARLSLQTPSALSNRGRKQPSRWSTLRSLWVRWRTLAPRCSGCSTWARISTATPTTRSPCPQRTGRRLCPWRPWRTLEEVRARGTIPGPGPNQGPNSGPMRRNRNPYLVGDEAAQTHTHASVTSHTCAGGYRTRRRATSRSWFGDVTRLYALPCVLVAV